MTCPWIIRLSLYHTILRNRKLFKTMWEKEKMQGTNVAKMMLTNILLSANAFNMAKAKILLFGKE